MKKSPTNVTVTVEVGYCSFCDRSRNLRREERRFGGLVRTMVACETCHRILASNMGVPAVQPAAPPAPVEPAPELDGEPVEAPPVEAAAPPRTRKASAPRPSKPAATRRPASKQ
jgi:hypothetical protein